MLAQKMFSVRSRDRRHVLPGSTELTHLFFYVIEHITI